MLAQKYNYSPPRGPVIEIAVGDAGIGMRASLRRNPTLATIVGDDRTALKQAIKGGVSRYRDAGRGYGLEHIVYEIQGKHRRLVLRSGFGCLVVYGNGSMKTFLRKPLVGVLATAYIPV